MLIECQICNPSESIIQSGTHIGQANKHHALQKLEISCNQVVSYSINWERRSPVTRDHGH